MVQTLLIEVICKQSSTLTIRAFRCFQTGQMQIIIPIEGKFKGKDSFMFVCAKEQQTLSIQFFLICLRALGNNFNGFVFCEFFHLFISPQICKKKRRLRHRSVTRLLLHDWFFCRPPTLSSIWSMTILLHLYRVFLLPANAPAQSPASISDFRCQSHQRDDALYPSLIICKIGRKVNKGHWKIILPAFSLCGAVYHAACWGAPHLEKTFCFFD